MQLRSSKVHRMNGQYGAIAYPLASLTASQADPRQARPDDAKRCGLRNRILNDGSEDGVVVVVGAGEKRHAVAEYAERSVGIRVGRDRILRLQPPVRGIEEVQIIEK